MGLDNGIDVKINDKIPGYAFKCFYSEWRNKYKLDLQVAYWRKCWNVRNMIIETLNIKEVNDSRTTMSIDDVDKVIKMLKRINKKNWLDYGECFWDWKDFKYNNNRNVKNLKLLRKFMKRNPKVFEVYFYDSY